MKGWYLIGKYFSWQSIAGTLTCETERLLLSLEGWLLSSPEPDLYP